MKTILNNCLLLITIIVVSIVTTASVVRVAHADDLLVESGTPEAEGCYVQEGEFLWVQQDGIYQIAQNPDIGAENYAIFNFVSMPDPIDAQAFVNLGEPPTSANIAASSGFWSLIGVSSPLNFTETTCEGPPPPPIMPTDYGGATSSVDQSQQNLYNAFLLFYVSLFGMVWLIRKH